MGWDNKNEIKNDNCAIRLSKSIIIEETFEQFQWTYMQLMPKCSKFFRGSEILNAINAWNCSKCLIAGNS